MREPSTLRSFAIASSIFLCEQDPEYPVSIRRPVRGVLLQPGAFLTDLRLLPRAQTRARGVTSTATQHTTSQRAKHSGLRTLLAAAAEAEAKRGLIVIPIAIERHRLKHGTHPENLRDLTPSVLANEPLDFIDGQPLQ